jgi:FkbM family methyltransferase
MANLRIIDYELEGVTEWMTIEGDNAFKDIGDGWPKYKEVISEFVPNKRVAIQAGGYCGIFPRCLSMMFDTVYTFEPDPLNFRCLVYNNTDTNVIMMQAALGNMHQMISMNYQHPNNAGMKNVVRQDNSIIPMLCVDDLNLKRCDLIMLDTEGFEYQALLGAENTIDKYRPLISVEDTNEAIDNLLAPYGYSKITTVYRDTIYGI